MFAWFSDLTPRERRTMTACFGGWSLDALDVQIFSFVIPSLLVLWHISTAEAGILGTITLLVSALGGWLAGALADRYGRVRVLQVTIVWYAVFTFLCGFAQDFTQLFIFRALQGLGFGGEWAAGAVLPAEYAWRTLFWIGLAPAALVFFIRRYVEEPEIRRDVEAPTGLLHIFSALKPPYLSVTWRVALMVTGAQGGG